MAPPDGRLEVGRLRGRSPVRAARRRCLGDGLGTVSVANWGWVELVTTGAAPPKLPGKPLDDTELSIIGGCSFFCVLFPKLGLDFLRSFCGHQETVRLLRLYIIRYETTNLGHLSRGQISLLRRIGAISNLRGTCLLYTCTGTPSASTTSSLGRRCRGICA